MVIPAKAGIQRLVASKADNMVIPAKAGIQRLLAKVSNTTPGPGLRRGEANLGDLI